MPSSIAVSDLKVGMFIKLELGWMSHPFPLSSFRIASAEQVSTLRALGLREVQWFPERSDPQLFAPELHDSPAPIVVLPSPEEQAAQRRRARLAEQRAGLRRCEAQHAEATEQLRRAFSMAAADPRNAAGQARELTSAMLDKMLVDGEMCIRMLSTQAGDKAAAHALNVSVIVLLLGRSLGMSREDLMDLGTGALLHDVGKIDLPTRVHHPEEGFSHAELKAYRDHVSLGVARGRQMQLSPAALQVLAQHHELADGSGFPQRLPLDALSPLARMVALVNRYDNLCNPGPRGTACTPHEAVSVLFSQSRGKFDMPLLSGFIRMMGVYPAGSVVQLTDDRYALVDQVNSSRPLKPRVLVHDPKVPRDEALVLDLEQCGDLGIRRSMAPGQLPPEALAYLAPRPRVSYYFDAVPQPDDAVEALD